MHADPVPSFEVIPYSIDVLKQLLVTKANTRPHVIDAKLHSTYFQNYFSEIGAKTIVVENDYVDRDYLEDYSSYYIRSFHPYQRHCTRLHFFELAFDESDLSAILSGSRSMPDVQELQSTYLGFIVVKPLPQTVIGRTCLKTYDDAHGQRFFPIVRTYQVSMFGINLAVDTLAFQEQDTVVAACATSALWSIFQGTGLKFQHPIPSPVEITTMANANLPFETRTFPNQGLTTFQMAQAIRKVGLDPFLVRVANDMYALKSILYAYLRGGIPVLMGVDIFEPTRAGGSIKHAVAITGYRLERPVPKPYPPPNSSRSFLLRASGLSRIYAHDDQVGPFARMAFDSVGPIPITGLGPRESISTSWGGGHFRAAPDIVMVPLYPKMRIPFDVIYSLVTKFDSFIAELAQNTGALPNEQLEWDIYLIEVNRFKQEIFEMHSLDGHVRLDVLTQPMPRYLWRATAYQSGNRILDLIFDATDIEQGIPFFRAVEYDDTFSLVLGTISREPWVETTYKTRAEWKVLGILDWFKNQPIP